MKTYLAFTAALISGFALGLPAQSGPHASAGAADAPAATEGPAKIAVIAFEAVVTQTNEFQRDMADLQKKYEPKRQALQALSSQIETMQKQLQGGSATLSDAAREQQARTISEKQKQLQRDQEDDQNDFQQDMQTSFSGVAGKVGNLMISYAQQHGFTLVLDSGNQQAQMVLYHNPSTDISQVVMEAYNVKSGIPAPASQSAPAAPKPAPKAPATHATPQTQH
jgi:outer membrane protein